MKQWRSLLLGVLVTVATLTFALWGNDLSQVGAEFARANYLPAIPCFVIMLIGLWTRGYRWRTLLNDRIPADRSFNILNIGYFLGVLLPFRLGEVARAYLTTRLTPPISMFTSLSSIVAERLIDLLTVIFLIVIAFTLIPLPPGVDRAATVTVERLALTTGVLAVIGIIVLLVFAVHRKLAHQMLALALRLLPFLRRFGLEKLMDRILDGIAPLGSVKGGLSIVFWTAVSWFTSVLAGYVLMFAFYAEPNWFATLLIIASASFAVALPAVPGNVGPFEASIILGLAAGGMISDDRSKAFAFALLIHAINVLAYVTCGYVGLLREKVSLGELLRTTRQVAGRLKQDEGELEGVK